MLHKVAVLFAALDLLRGDVEEIVEVVREGRIAVVHRHGPARLGEDVQQYLVGLDGDEHGLGLLEVVAKAGEVGPHRLLDAAPVEIHF